MLKNIMVLSDGTELAAGIGQQYPVQSVTLTQCVNMGTELAPGAACANMLEATVFTPEGQSPVQAGMELGLYSQAEDGVRTLLGTFIAEKPTRPSANMCRIIAYDFVSRLDRDLTHWLGALNGWPYELHTFAKMVCGACGLTLINETIPNGDYPVQKFAGEGITGRQLIQWVGQAAGRFCRATPTGDLEFAWYKPTPYVVAASATPAAVCHNGDLQITDPRAEVLFEQGHLRLNAETFTADAGGALAVNAPSIYYFQNGLTFEDYSVARIDKVQIRLTDTDVGAVYPDDGEVGNAYIVTGNYLLTANSTQQLQTVAKEVFETLKEVTYTPCKVSVPANNQIWPGDIVGVTDKNGKAFSMYVMEKTRRGQTDTLSCTGSPRRDSTTVRNNATYQALRGKVLELQLGVEGLRIENREAEGRLASIALDVNGLVSGVSQQSSDINGLKTELTQVSQTAQDMSLQVKGIQEKGASRVETATGYIFDAEGLKISKDGQEMENRLDNTGMYVERSGQTVLQANQDGVEAKNLHASTYLTMAGQSRFESYSPDRTGCFWVGG